MSDLKPARCPISGLTESRLVFSLAAPPAGETGFARPPGQPYYREVWQFAGSRHYVNRHAMTMAAGYDGDYVSATYGDAAGVAARFHKVIGLPPAQSDNAQRIAAIRAYAARHFPAGHAIRLADIGAGLGVFPHAVKQAGWHCTAVDPDPRAVEHMKTVVGVEAVCGDFHTLDGIGRFDIVTFNKVLEHVPDPVAMLARTRAFLEPGGLVYVELPDGEAALAAGGPGRQEFFVEHIHVFSMTSIVMLAEAAGFRPLALERLREPSGKYTLRAFCVAAPATI
jgi:SAM-dependent methyltransferase